MTQEELNEYRSRGVYLFEVIDILKEHYGEDRVDAQIEGDYLPHATIIIHYPEVRVTNEFDKYIDIQDLYVKFEVRYSGTIAAGYNALSMMRTTFNIEQYLSGYQHSHLMRNEIGRWSHPCLGMGPIKNTISSLNVNFDEMLWIVFCNELDTWTRVESLTGGPYFKMETLGASSLNEYTVNYNSTGAIPFSIGEDINSKTIIKRLLDNSLLKFCFNGNYNLSISPTRFTILVSNIALEMIKERYSPDKVNDIIDRYFKPYIINNGKLYKINHNNYSVTQERQEMLTFKGQIIYLKILEDNAEEIIRNSVPILSSGKVESIYTQLINIVNSLYGRITTEGKTAIL